MKTEASVVNYFITAMKQAYEAASAQYYGSTKFFEKAAYSVYMAFEDRCREHPTFNNKESAKKIRQLIIDYYVKNQYYTPTAMRTFIRELPEKFKVRGEYEPLTLE